MIGRLHHMIVDCPDPAKLARIRAEGRPTGTGFHITK